ncbi:MAG: ATP-dependent Clp protease proteolytic subunit [Parcubacteria group bacterium]|nr:ATP-dependent Clp protease proteolytic subunit [Parcubacteria group bacterium]
MRERKFKRDLLKKRVIYLESMDNLIADEIGKIITRLNAKNYDEIKVIIDSDGGGIDAGFDMHDIIRLSEAPITGIVYRRANSMAIIVLQACRVRKAMANASFYFHNIKLDIDKEWNEIEKYLKENYDRLEKYQNRYYEIIANRSGRSTNEIRELCLLKKCLNAEEALKLGIIDEII